MSSARQLLKKNKWLRWAWPLIIGFVLLAIAVVVAKGLRQLPPVEAFIADFPGTSSLPSAAPVGIPPWLGWQHFFNMFLMLFIIRAGWQIRSAHPRLSAQHWSPKKQLSRASPSPTAPARIGLAVWWHLVVNALWVVNGIVFYILIFSTGQWMRLVPLSWDVLPHAVSVVIQYASLDWPLESGWVNYNGLQLITYFVTVFVAAPLAIATGVRMAPGISARVGRVAAVFPVQYARVLHFRVMVWFIAFIFVHVTLVLATGALRNLNHMYASRDDESWVGFAVFAASLAVATIGWIATTPASIRYLASLTGSVSR